MHIVLNYATIFTIPVSKCETFSFNLTYLCGYEFSFNTNILKFSSLKSL